MPKLKDYFEKDLGVFINDDEFATEVLIDNEPTLVVLDSDSLKELQLKNGGEGLATSELLFYVKKTDLKFKPFVGQDIFLNEKLYYINDVKEDEGIYEIVLGVTKS